MMTRFEKWEGLGNDFVLLRDLQRDLDDAEVQRLCDRRFGVGADGVLLVETHGSVPRMIVRNADGSRPEMCGNGLRCVAGHLARGPDSSCKLTIATNAGDKVCDVRALDAGRFDVAVEMGPALRGPELVVRIEGDEHRFHTLDLGNPHAVTFEPHDDGALERIGAVVAVLPEGGTNVELCRAEPGRISVLVWERGVGRTLACGTGACAVAAAACDTGRARFDEPVIVALPGGDLEITVASGTRAVRMRGPARRVFTGEVVIA